MSVRKVQLYPQKYPQKILLFLCIACELLVYPLTASSESSQRIRILKVTVTPNTTFKQRNNWYQQSNEIDNDKKCFAKKGEKFFISSIRKQIRKAPLAPKGNYERLGDYWEVTFDKPLPCELQGINNPTWFVYKKHVEELQAVPLR